MNSTLIPERPLLISATLAATIGLDETVMLHVLGELVNQQRGVSSNDRTLGLLLSEERMDTVFPFWKIEKIRGVQQSLEAMGLIVSELKNDGSGDVIITLVDDSPSNENSAGTQIDDAYQRSGVRRQPASNKPTQTNPQATNKGMIEGRSFLANGGKTLIPLNWSPDSSWVAQCKQHNISDEFLEKVLPSFVSYWRDRGQAHFSWGNVFLKHVIREWRAEQNRSGIAEHGADMSSHWCPSDDAMSILENADINLSFIEDAVPEFILFWQERGVQKGAWNSKFIEHVRRQWARYSASLGFDDTPRPIPKDWLPSADFYEILEMAEIDSAFAESKIAEFVLYWRDSQQAKASWNTAFLQFIKAAWSRRLRDSENGVSSYASGFQGSGTNQQNIESRLQSLADRSWAD
jgi:hypothetical protein